MVQLVGNVVKDATSNDRNGKHVINFTIALNYQYTDAKGKVVKLPTFIDCEFWKHSEVYKYITKGRPIIVFGRLYPHAYTNAKGEAKANIRCNVNSIELLSGGTNGLSQHDDQTSSNDDEGEPVHTLKVDMVEEPVEDLPF